MIIAVSGASGFIGRRLSEVLERHGHEVVAITRRSGEELERTCSRVCVVPDFGNTPLLQTALAGCGAFVHLAGRAHKMRESSHGASGEHEAGTRKLAIDAFHAAMRAEVPHVVYMSSVAAADDVKFEDAAGGGNAYARAKRQAEEDLMRAAQASDTMRLTILRPPGVYGAGMKGNPLALVRLIDKGIPVPLPWPAPQRSFVYVDNLVSAVQHVIEAPARASGVYAVADRESVELDTLVSWIAQGLGRPRRVVRLPRRLIAALKVFVPLARLAKAEASESAIDRLLADLVVDSSEFCRAFRWRAPVAASDGWAETCRSFARERR